MVCEAKSTSSDDQLPKSETFSLCPPPVQIRDFSLTGKTLIAPETRAGISAEEYTPSCFSTPSTISEETETTTPSGKRNSEPVSSVNAIPSGKGFKAVESQIKAPSAAMLSDLTAVKAAFAPESHMQPLLIVISPSVAWMRFRNLLVAAISESIQSDTMPLTAKLQVINVPAPFPFKVSVAFSSERTLAAALALLSSDTLVSIPKPFMV